MGTQIGIRGIINISKEGETDITSIQIGNVTVKKSSSKQIEEKLVKPKYKYLKYLTNPNTNSFFTSPTNYRCAIGNKKLSNNKSTGSASITS